MEHYSRERFPQALDGQLVRRTTDEIRARGKVA
jgi:hypothetical protein